MGSGNSMKRIITGTQDKERKDNLYAERRKESDAARGNVSAGLSSGANYQPIDLDGFAQEKRDAARSRRATKRDERQARREEREDYYRQQMDERRRQNEMRKPKEEMGGVGVLGANNPYGDDAVWDNNTRSWAPNPKPDTVTQWDNYRNQSQVAPQGETNLFGQSRGVNLGPGSADRGAVNGQPQTGGDNRDFKKLYEELLKIHNAGKK